MHRAAVLIALLAACARPTPTPAARVATAVDTTTTAAQALPPCGGAAPSGMDWREVTAPGFRFCVPADWRPGTRQDRTAAASGQWRGGEREWVQWAVGPFKDAPGMTLPYNEVRRESAVIGGRSLEITVLVLPQSYTSFAHWDSTVGARALTLTGYAADEARLARVRQVVQTVRFDSTTRR